MDVDSKPGMEETILVGDDLMMGPPSPDKELRQRLQDSERKLGMSMPLNLANERSTQLEAEATQLERRLILASGVEGMEGFRQRWSLHGRLTDTKKQLEALKLGIESRKKDETVGESSTKKRWFFW
ncbi:uncharacterized protein LOC125218173 isoform X3 [Salvia hispanica]|uniref:uncharacterized protein LOC125218173 isoform X3 n=1 Tax=Salvia hispanica TaxID=49212 RepID=UPI0020091906|nr:uncharacterized protein LOC125218173 isoform X3 [Salvia hispanica]